MIGHHLARTHLLRAAKTSLAGLGSDPMPAQPTPVGVYAEAAEALDDLEATTAREVAEWMGWTEATSRHRLWWLVRHGHAAAGRVVTDHHSSWVYRSLAAVREGR